MTHVSTQEVYIFYTEEAAVNFIDDFKAKYAPCPCEHSIKYKAKKDRKTQEIIEQTFTATCKVKYTV